MKIKNLLFAFFAYILLLQLAGCKPQSPKIGILFHSYENERWTKDRDYLVENLQKLGATVMVKVADNDSKRQIDQAETMIRNGVQALIVISVNQDEAAKIVEIAHEANVKVIAYDRLIKNCKLDYYVTTNSTHVGELQAKYITSIKPNGNYALICGSKYDDNSRKLFLGQMNVLQPYMERGDIHLVYSDFTEAWTPDEGALHTTRVLEQSGDSVTAIIAGSDAIATGVLDILRGKGLSGKVLVAGQDAELSNIKAILAGQQTCDILKPLKQMAATASEIAVIVANGKTPEMKFTSESNGKFLIKSVLLNAEIVNKDNIEKTVVASGLHTANELK
jgi:ABC-type xylose transport system, periplasmic component